MHRASISSPCTNSRAHVRSSGIRPEHAGCPGVFFLTFLFRFFVHFYLKETKEEVGFHSEKTHGYLRYCTNSEARVFVDMNSDRELFMAQLRIPDNVWQFYTTTESMLDHQVSRTGRKGQQQHMTTKWIEEVLETKQHQQH